MDPSSSNLLGSVASGGDSNPQPPGHEHEVSALVVGVGPAETQAIVSLLTDLRFHVTLANSYARGRERLAARPPSLLITEIRLGEYNGLQLVLHGRSVRPGMAAIAWSSADDPVLQADAEALGATFVARPISGDELTAAVLRTLAASISGAAAPRPPFERRAAERRARTLPIGWERRLIERRQGPEPPRDLTRE